MGFVAGFVVGAKSLFDIDFPLWFVWFWWDFCFVNRCLLLIMLYLVGAILHKNKNEILAFFHLVLL